MEAFLSNMLWLPRGDGTDRVLQSIANDTNVTWYESPDKIGAKAVRNDMSLLKWTSKFVGVPRALAAKHLGLNGSRDLTSFGSPVDFRSRVELRDEQVGIYHQMLAACQKYRDFQMQLRTGGGKTVVALHTIATLGQRALVLVDQEFLRDQWIERAEEFLGLDRSQIGLIQGKRMEYDKPLVIGMIQTLMNKETLPYHISSAFGVVVVDECHTVGAPIFSRVLSLFSARVRFGVTATPRKGALAKVIAAHLGDVQVKLEAEHTRSQLRVVSYSGNAYSWYANNAPKTYSLVSEIAEDPKRNELLAEVICYLYQNDRQVLVVSDRTQHLENLRSICQYRGIPAVKMGVCVGTGSEWRYVVDTEKADDELNYTPVKMERVPKKTRREDLKRIREENQIIFATYKIFDKGVDVPRLDAGVDATPRASSAQVHGRILRVLSGKKVPLWVTVIDEDSQRCCKMAAGRLNQYSNVEVKTWLIGRGTRKTTLDQCQAKLTQRMRALSVMTITTTVDGRSTIATHCTATRQSAGR